MSKFSTPGVGYRLTGIVKVVQQPFALNAFGKEAV
jgi:hypothetical protein